MWLLHMPTRCSGRHGGGAEFHSVLRFRGNLGDGHHRRPRDVRFDPAYPSSGAAYLALATVEGQLIEPIFFGRRLQLNPVIVFVALWLGGWLWGIAGILLALPVLVATKVAASQPGGNDGVLRFLGSAAPKPTEEPKGGDSRSEVPTLRPRESR